MSAAAIRGVVRRLGPSADPPPDADLVSAFAARRDADAFAALVARHGPTVFGVCRRVLGDAHAAEDAFQAVFFVLAQKVKAVRPPGAVGGWLYGVAVRTANKAKVAAARRRRREMIAASNSASRERKRPEDSPERAELQSILDAELAKLPETLRAAVVLCDLHGKTRAEAAAELGCPAGTVAARLHRARKKLGDALARRGLTLPAAGLATVLTPVAVSAAASRSAVAVAFGSATPAVLALAREVIRSMSTSTYAIALGAITLLTGGLFAAGNLWSSDPPQTPPPPPPIEARVDQPAAKPAGPWKEAKVLEHAGWLAGSVAYSGDGKTLFVSGTDGHVRAYETVTWKQLWEYKGDGRFTAVACAPDDKTVAATFKDGPSSGVRFLDATTGKLGDTLEEQNALKEWPEPLAVSFFANSVIFPEGGDKPVITTHKLIFGNTREYVVKTWLVGGKASTIKSGIVAAGKEPADAYAAPIAVSPDGKRVVVTGPVDRDTGKNVLWAWSAGSGEANKLLEGHKATVVAAAWSKDGKTILTGDVDGVVIAWDAATFREKSRLSLGGRVAAVAISTDGKHVAAATSSVFVGPRQEAYVEEVFVWPAANQPEKPASISEHKAGGPFKGVASLAFAPDGKTLVSAFCNFDHLSKLGVLVGKVRAFTMADEQPKPPEKPGFVHDVRFSPDGSRYVVSPGVTVHDASGKTLYTVRGEAAGFSVDGKTLFVMGEKVLECDATTGKVLKEHPRPKTKWGWHLVAFSPDGNRYAAHFGFNVRVYDTATGFEPKQLDNQHEPGSSALPATVGKQLMWSPDGKQVAAVGVLVDVGKVGMAGWEVESGKRFYSFAADFEDGPRAVSFSNDSKSIAIGYEKRIDVWTGGLNPVKKLGEQGLVTALAFSKDGKQIAAGIRLPILHGGDKLPRVIGHKTEVRLIDIATDKVLKVFDGFEGVNHMATTKLPVTALAFSPSGKKLIAVTGIPLLMEIPKDAPKSGEVKVFDVPDPPEKPDPAPAAAQKWTDAAVLSDHGRLVNGVAVAPDGKSFAAATDGNVTCWDAITRKVLWKTKFDSPVAALAFSPDGKHICVAGTLDVFRLNAATGKDEPWSPRPDDDKEIRFGKMRALTYHPGGDRLAASDGYVTKVQRLAIKPEEITFGAPPKQTEPAPVRAAALAWSKDGKQLALIRHEKDGKDEMVLWGAGSGEAMKVLKGHADTVTAVAWSKDGKFIASGGEDGLVILWDPKTGKELWRKLFEGRDDTIGRVNALAFSPADNTIAVAVSLGSGKQAERVALLAAKDGAYVDQVMRWSIPVASVAWSLDGKYLITGCGSAGQAIEQSEKAVGEVVIWERKP